MNITMLETRSIPEMWHTVLYKLVEGYKNGTGVRRYKVDRGSNPGVDRIEFEFVVLKISHPGEGSMLPTIPEHLSTPSPVDESYLADYVGQLMSTELQPNEHYTYGNRLHGVKIEVEGKLLGPYDFVTEFYRRNGGNTNEMCLEVGQPSDVFSYVSESGSSPCLRLIDTRLDETNKLNWVVYFRSWNAWSGLPANLAGLEVMKQAMAHQIGCENGEIIAMSKGLNIRAYQIPVVEQLLCRSVES